MQTVEKVVPLLRLPSVLQATGTVMGQTILLAKNGETFVLGSTPIWVRPMVAALAVAREGGAA